MRIRHLHWLVRNHLCLLHTHPNTLSISPHGILRELLQYEEAFAPYDETGIPSLRHWRKSQTMAQWYVRKNNKYYDVDIPGEELSRDDVERVTYSV